MPDLGPDAIRSLRLELLFQLLLAVLAGGAIGLERELKRQARRAAHQRPDLPGRDALHGALVPDGGPPRRSRTRRRPDPARRRLHRRRHHPAHARHVTSAARHDLVVRHRHGPGLARLPRGARLDRARDRGAGRRRAARRRCHARTPPGRPRSPERDALEQLEDLVRITGPDAGRGRLGAARTSTWSVDFSAERPEAPPRRAADRAVHHPLVRGVSRGE